MIQAQVRIQALEPSILLLQFPHPLQIRQLHPAVLRSSLVKRRRADAVLARDFRHRIPASASFRIAAICTSLNFDFRMGLSFAESLYYSMGSL